MSIYGPGLKDSTFFIIQNISSSNRSVKVFNTTILPKTTLDLMSIEGIVDEDIKASLLKGELKRRLDNKTIKIISSNIGFSSSDSTFLAKLSSYGIQGKSTEILFGLSSNTSPLDFNGQRLINVSDPVGNSDVTTKSYSDTGDISEVNLRTAANNLTTSLNVNGKSIINAASASKNGVIAAAGQLATVAYVDQTSVKDLSAPTFLNWTIDSVSGDDGAVNGGTLKTAKQWAKRMGGAQISGSMNITQAKDLLTTDSWDFTGISTGEAGGITIDGTSAISTSDLPALTAVQNISLANPTDCAQYCTITGHTWSETGSYVKIKAGGSNPGAISYVGIDQTAGKARFAPFILNPTFNSSNVNPIVGDILQTCTLPKGRNLLLSSVNTAISFKNIDFDDFNGNGHNLIGQGYSLVQFFSCILRGFVFYTQNISLYHCQIPSGGSLFASGTPNPIICGGRFATSSTGFQSNSINIDNHALFEGGNIRLFGAGGTFMSSIGKVGVYSSGISDGAVIVAQGAICLFGNSLSGTSAIYGTCGYNVASRNYGRTFYDSVQGESNIFKVNTTLAKYRQGASNSSGPLPLAPDAGLNSIVAWT